MAAKSKAKKDLPWGHGQLRRLKTEAQFARHAPELDADEREPAIWVVGLCCGPVGPYTHKGEAADDLAGLERFYRSNRRFFFGKAKP